MRKEARAMGARFKTEGITLKKGDLIMALTSNQHVLDWVKEMEELMTPDKTGSTVRKASCAPGVSRRSPRAS